MKRMMCCMLLAVTVLQPVVLGDEWYVDLSASNSVSERDGGSYERRWAGVAELVQWGRIGVNDDPGWIRGDEYCPSCTDGVEPGDTVYLCGSGVIRESFSIQTSDDQLRTIWRGDCTADDQTPDPGVLVGVTLGSEGPEAVPLNVSGRSNTISHLTLSRLADYSKASVIGISSEDTIVEDCKLSFLPGSIGDDVIKITAYKRGQHLVTGDRTEITRCLIQNAQDQGIDGLGVHDVHIHHNQFVNNYLSIVCKGNAEGWDIHDNHFMGDEHESILIGASVGSTSFLRHGRRSYQAKDCVVWNNVIGPNKRGLAMAALGAWNCTFMHNTLYGSFQVGSTWTRCGPIDPIQGERKVSIKTTQYSKDITFKNNIVTSLLNNIVVSFDDMRYPDSMVFDHNVYFAVSGSQARFRNHFRDVLESSHDHFDGYKATMAEFGQEQSSVFAYSYFPDAMPYLAEDFELTSVSCAAIDQGVEAPELDRTEDFNGQPIVGQPDIGAFELQEPSHCD